MLSPAEARTTAEKLVERGLRAGANAADALYVGDRSSSVQVRLGKLEDVGRSEGAQVGLRLFVGQRSATVASSDLSDEVLGMLVERCLAMAREAPEDPYAGLAPPELLQHGKNPRLDISDPIHPDPEELRSRALEAENAALGVVGVTNSSGAGASASSTIIALATSGGFSGTYEGRAGTDIVPDSERRGFIGALPARLRPFASLMRLDRPIGTWLLYWPCAWSVGLAGVAGRWDLFLWLGLGALAARSAGCVYNDIVDRDLDVRVERTRLRPLASGRVSLRSAWAAIALLCAVGMVVVAELKWVAAIIALLSIIPVAAYPFMKRITWWPQAWLGLVFSWGALVGWPAVTGSFAIAPLLLWLGSVSWVIGYDTLYAIQDKEDDALIGVKSSARRLGKHAPAGIAIFYAIALLLWGAAVWNVRPDWVALLTLVPAALHLANQALRADPDDGDLALRLFRSNRSFGLLLFFAMLVVGLSAR